MILSAWSEFNDLQFNFAKCAVLHFGAKNSNFEYNVNNHVLPSSESVQDLGVTRNTKLTYEEHCVNIIRCANCTSSHILRTFASRNSYFMVKISIVYVRPILKCASQVWFPSNVYLINRVERVQRLFTKRIRPVAHLPYSEHLNKLGLQRLESRRLYLDVLFLAKLKFNYFYLTLNDFDVRVTNLHNNRFISLPSYSRVTYYFYTVRKIHLWNSLHNNVTAARTIYVLCRLLSNINFIPYLQGHA